MRLLNIQLTNFASYSTLEFSFENQGLALLYGSTGSGKSTLQDAPAWILFGITAKDGNADDVRSWNNPGEHTQGILKLEANDGILISITRIRGKPSQNDLYWLEGDSDELHRGKDITETQKLLDDRLGVSKELYIAAAYYNEFSPTGAFFTSKSKDRRELFEKLADLDLPIKIADGAIDAKKQTRKTHTQVFTDINQTNGRLEQLELSAVATKRDADNWSKVQEATVKDLQQKERTFEQEKQNKINDLMHQKMSAEALKAKTVDTLLDKIQGLEAKISNSTEYCESCGQPHKDTVNHKIELGKLKLNLEHLVISTNPYDKQLEYATQSENPYSLKLGRLESENPFLPQIERQTKEISKLEQKFNGLRATLSTLDTRLSAVTRLYDLSFSLRGELLLKSVKEVESETNRYLESYFDSELRVTFNIEDSDKLEIEITKNGHTCVYRQLSKGQRCLLKLCFSVSIMKAAANRIGVHFNTLLFDEALDGLDPSLKAKAFNLFSELSKYHETILVIEHDSSLLSLFNKHYYVSLISDESHIEEV